MHHSRASAALIMAWRCSSRYVWRRSSNATQLGQPPKEPDFSRRLLDDCPPDILAEQGFAKVINSSCVGDISSFLDILSSKGNNTSIIRLFIGFTMPIIHGKFYKSHLL